MRIRNVEVNIKSKSPLSWSRHYTEDDVPRIGNESKAQYDARTWQQRLHLAEKGTVAIPAIAFRHALVSCCSYHRETIPGKGKSEYKKHFLAGIIPDCEYVDTGVALKKVMAEKLFVPADGRTGGTTRVQKIFPRLESWKGKLSMLVYDEDITNEVFERYLRDTGILVGIGRWRPERGGIYGRFEPVKFKWAVV